MNNIEKKLLSKRFGKIDPLCIDDYINSGGYEALQKAIGMSPNEIIEDVKESGLLGRGGAGYPTGLKMELVQQAKEQEKYLICNADEGEPGNFKDRYLMENDPHQIIEGMVISALAVGAQKGFIFIRGEYTQPIYILRHAIKEAVDRNYLGQNILGCGHDFDIELYIGAGSYVCGEEFALMLCIEGNAGRSTFKPPFPTTQGLYNKPTQINNVETFANIPHIVLDGPEAFAAIGTESSKGTKLVSLCGNVRARGVFELPFGVTFRQIIEVLGRGCSSGGIKMVQLGGASGSCIPPNMLGLKLDYKEMQDNDFTFGSGAIIVMNDKIDVLDIVRNTLEFFRHESCGKCTPCREGIEHLIILLERFIEGVATKKDLELLEMLIDTIRQTSICGLGQSAPTSLRTTLKYFRQEYTSRINKYNTKAV